MKDRLDFSVTAIAGSMLGSSMLLTIPMTFFALNLQFPSVASACVNEANAASVAAPLPEFLAQVPVIFGSETRAETGAAWTCKGKGESCTDSDECCKSVWRWLICEWGKCT